MKISHDIRSLKEIYNDNKMVPFIGAGLSKPFNLPDWKMLLLDLCNELIDDEDIQEMIKSSIDANKYWEAIEEIIEYSYKDERYIRQMVADIFNKSMITNIDSQDSNYVDLDSLEVPYYLTTNYDNLLGRYIKSNYQPTILNISDGSTQIWARDKVGKRVIHLHGDVANIGSIVLSRRSYDDVYTSIKYKELFNFFRSGYTFLFIGFSFSDEYIIKLMKEYGDIFNDYHYILVANPTKEIRRQYMDKYRLHVIEYTVEDMGDTMQHIQAIRKILEMIKNGVEKENF